MQRFIEFYYRHKLFSSAVLVLCIVALFSLNPNIAFAADGVETTSIVNNINEIFNVILKFSSSLLFPVLLMMGSLLDNTLIFGGSMGDRLLDVWVQMRNLVNILFVIILLGIAVYNVLGLGQEGGLPLAFKTALPKFVIALIVVNFSFLGVRLILDFTNVITGAVFALPAKVGDISNVEGQMQAILCGSDDQTINRPDWCDKDGKFTPRGKQFFARLDRNNVALVYAVKFGSAINMKFIRRGVSDITQLAFNILFNTVLYVVYALSFMALFLVLLFRIVTMWVFVALSPFMAIAIVLPNLKQLAGEAGDVGDKFIKHAMAPITIGLFLSVGYIMLDGFSVTRLKSMTLTAVDPNALPTGIDDLQQLLIAVGSVVVVWGGVFGAASGTYAQGITNIIKGHAERFGSFLAKLPTYAQILPVSVTGGEEPSSIAQIYKGLQNTMLNIESRGTLFGPTAVSQEDVDAFNKAMHTGAREFLDGIKEKPYALQMSTAQEAFRIGAQKHFHLTEEEVKGLKDPESIAKAIFDNPKLQRSVGNQLRIAGIASNSQELLAKIRAAPRPAAETEGADEGAKITPEPASIIKALIDDSTPSPLVVGQEVFSGWNTEDVDKMKAALDTLGDPLLRKASILIDNGVVRKEFIENDMAAPFRELFTALKDEGRSDQSVADAVTKAKQAMPNPAARQYLEELIRQVQLSPTQRTAALSALREGPNPPPQSGQAR